MTTETLLLYYTLVASCLCLAFLAALHIHLSRIYRDYDKQAQAAKYWREEYFAAQRRIKSLRGAYTKAGKPFPPETTDIKTNK
jgi:hypothetical protein